jgi:undecaprenyl-diphosphatase
MHRRGALTACLTCAAIIVVAAVASSRLYLGVHWLTDVVAGVLLGSAVVAIGATVLRGLTENDEGRPTSDDTGPQRREVLL